GVAGAGKSREQALVFSSHATFNPGPRRSSSMSPTSPQYEFSTEENALFASLAHKMRWVGLFFTVVGVLSLLVTALLVAAIYRNQLPAGWVSQLPPEAQSHLRDLPPNSRLWGFALNAGLSGLIYLLIGLWTRSAAASFLRIATTQGRD